MKTIILHGWTKNLDNWNDFLKKLDKKKIDYEFPKIPGLTEKLDEVWNLNDYVNWLGKIVDKQKDKVTLIGHSNGGRIALAYTNLHPDRVERLILIDSAGIYHNELLLKIKRLIFKNVAKLGKRITSSKILKDFLYKLTRESDYKDLDENIKKTMTNLISSDLKPILSQIKVPTLIIWGAQDKLTPLSDGILMSNLIKSSKIAIISEARHAPMFTHSDQVLKIIYGNL